MFPPGLEPGTFRVLGERDNRYTTETCDEDKFYKIIKHCDVIKQLQRVLCEVEFNLWYIKVYLQTSLYSSNEKL